MMNIKHRLSLLGLAAALCAAAPAFAHEDLKLKAWLASQPASSTLPYEDAQLQAQLANLWQELGEGARAERLFAQSRQASAAVREPYVQDLLMGHLANELASGANFERALQTLDAVRDGEVWVKTAWKLVGKLAKAGRRDEAAALLKRTEARAQATEEPMLRAELLSGTGASYRYIDKAHGENLVYEAYGIAQMLADPYERALMYNETGAHLMDIGHRELALQVFAQVEQRLVPQIKSPLQQAKALAMLGGEQAEKNLRERAVSALDQGRAIALRLPEGEDRAEVLSEIARNYGQSHRFEPGIATAEAIADPYHRIEGRIRIAKNMARTGHKDGALAQLALAETEARQVGKPHLRATVLRKLASEHIALGAKPHARALLGQAEASIAAPARVAGV